MSKTPKEKHNLLDAIIVGAGSSGICAAIELKQAGFNNFLVLEQGTGLGGTWFWNQYPGAECDVQSHLYSFSFEPNPYWSQPYAGQEEILSYLEQCATKHQILPHIHFNKEVVSAHWSDESYQWEIKTHDGQQYQSKVFVSALGMMNKIVWPNIQGRESFLGHYFHSARWNHDVDLSNKNIGVIGLAASAIQFVPELAKEAENLFLFQRTANWVVPKPNNPYSKLELKKFGEDGVSLKASRAEIYDQWNTLCTFSDKNILKGLEEDGLSQLSEVNDPELRKQLTPNHPFGCKRPLFSDNYYSVFNRKNVSLITDPIKSINPTGVTTSQGLTELDILVFATGFETTSFLKTIEVRGRDGLSIQDAWSDGAQAYLGVVSHGFPNMFMLYGPNTNQGSLLFMIEQQAKYLIKQLNRIKNEGLRSLEVQASVMNSFNEELQKDLKAVEVFQAECGNDFYYRSGPSGRMVTQWPYSMDAYRDALEEAKDNIYLTN
tara:strand:+ start:1394 stop:2863 length:1470 start_codon:yes stop_codon:yes gene_type:complete